MATANGNEDDLMKMEKPPASYDLNVKSLKTDTNSKNFFTIADDLASTYADDVKVMFDDNTEICTLLFIKKHVKPKMAGRTITMDAIHYEGVLEVKLPYVSAFLLGRYMTEVYKIHQANKSKQLRFGPTGIV
jgi:hypothetical protein